MNDKKYRLQSAAAVSIPADTVDRLLALGDGDGALLYLHLLRTGGALSEPLAARTLGRSEEEIRAAAERLDRAGLLSSDGPPLPGPEELPHYSADDILRRRDTAFSDLLTETQRVLGRGLSGPEMSTLFGIYDHLALPPEVVMQLIHFCAEQLRRKHGEGRLPTMRTIEKEAFRWANREIRTLDQAEAYIASVEQRDLDVSRARQALGIADRELSTSEKKYLEQWLAGGFSVEALALAYDRTVLKTGRLSWPYMNKILESWEQKKLFTPEAIEKEDPPRFPDRRKENGGDRSPAGKKTDAAPKGDDLDRLERMLNITR